jgi:hypothetical protein
VSIHEYKVRSCTDRIGVHLIADVLPFRCALLTGKDAVADAIAYAKLFSGSHAAVIRIYNTAGQLIAMHEHAGDFRESLVDATRSHLICSYKEVAVPKCERPLFHDGAFQLPKKILNR